MTSNIAIINPNQYQSYQRRKRKKEGRAGGKGKKEKKKKSSYLVATYSSILA